MPSIRSPLISTDHIVGAYNVLFTKRLEVIMMLFLVYVLFYNYRRPEFLSLHKLPFLWLLALCNPKKIISTGRFIVPSEIQCTLNSRINSASPELLDMSDKNIFMFTFFAYIYFIEWSAYKYS